MSTQIKSLVDMLKPDILIQNTYLFAILCIFLVVYGPRLQPWLPPTLRNLFNSRLFRAVILFTVVYMSSYNIQSSIVITVIFLITMNILHTYNVLETFQQEGFVVENGPPLHSCDLYDDDEIQDVGTAFYPLNTDEDENIY